MAPKLLERISWRSALSQAGYAKDSLRKLPATLLCQKCRRNTMLVFADSVRGGTRTFCTHCRTPSDPLKIVAARRKCSISTVGYSLRDVDEETLAKLIADYTREEAQIEQFHKLWNDNIVTPLFSDGVLSATLHGIGCYAWRMDPDRQELLLDVVRGCTRPEVLAAFAPLPDPRQAEKKLVEKRDSLFKKRRSSAWYNLLLMPQWYAPGQPAAGIFAGRAGGVPEDIVARRLRGVREWGLMYSTRLLAEDGPILCTNVVSTYMNLHSKNLKLHNEQMPVLCAYSPDGSPIIKAWEQFRNRRLLFCADTLNPEVFAQAVVAHGSVYPAYEFKQTLITTPYDLMQRALATASPWDIAVPTMLCSLDELQLLEHLLCLKKHGDDVLDSVLQLLPRSVLLRSRRLLDRPKQRVAGFSRRVTSVKRVIDKPSGWFLGVKGKPTYLLSAVKVYFRYRLITGTGEKYIGYVMYRNRRHLLHISTSATSSALRSAVQSCLDLATGVRPDVAGIDMPIVLAMSKPIKDIHGGQLGWQEDARRFGFGGFSIRLQSPHVVVEPWAKTVRPSTKTMPLFSAMPPKRRFLGDIARLLQQKNNGFWLFWRIVTYNFLAPAIGLRPTVFVFSSKLAQLMLKRFAAHWHCTADVVAGQQHSGLPSVLIGGTTQRIKSLVALLDDSSAWQNNLILWLPPAEASASVLMDNCVPVLTSTPVDPGVGDDIVSGADMLAHFIYWLVRQEMRPLSREDFATSLEAATISWLEQLGYTDFKAMRSVRTKFVREPAQRANYLLWHLINSDIPTELQKVGDEHFVSVAMSDIKQTFPETCRPLILIDSILKTLKSSVHTTAASVSCELSQSGGARVKIPYELWQHYFQAFAASVGNFRSRRVSELS